MSENFVSRTQVELLSERLKKAQETNATEDLYIYSHYLLRKCNFKKSRIMVVGAGGSYPSAHFAKIALSNDLQTPYVEAYTPQSAIRTLTQFNNCNYGKDNPRYDLVIGISYSGKTPDIKQVFKICIERNIKFLLLTGADESTLLDIYNESQDLKIVSYFNDEDKTGKERGMISMFSTLAPVAIFDDDPWIKLIKENQELLSKSEEFVSKLDILNIARKLKQNPVVHVFYTLEELPTALDIESKFTESGIANVILHESKNFSHGRYTLLYKQDFALIINLTRVGMAGENKIHRYKYDSILDNYLTDISNKKSAYYIDLGRQSFMPTQRNVEMMAILPYLITEIGIKQGIDISKPLKPFPEEPKMLYNYEGDF